MTVIYSPPKKRFRKRMRAPDRLVGWLRWYLRENNTKIWIRFDAERLATILKMSPRTVWRAKKYLMEHSEFYGIEWATLRSSESWQVIFASRENLKYDQCPLFYTPLGDCRRVKSWIRATKLMREGVLKRNDVTDNRNTIRGKPADKLLNKGDPLIPLARFRSAKTDGKYYEGLAAPRPPGDCIPPASGPPLAAEKGNAKRRWTKRNQAYSHALARKLSSMHWDNCKVVYIHTATVSFIRTLLQHGYKPREVIRIYFDSLHEGHSIATDHGLNNGDPKIKFSPAIVFKLAYERLGFHRIEWEGINIFIKSESVF